MNVLATQCTHSPFIIRTNSLSSTRLFCRQPTVLSSLIVRQPFKRNGRIRVSKFEQIIFIGIQIKLVRILAFLILLSQFSCSNNAVDTISFIIKISLLFSLGESLHIIIIRVNQMKPSIMWKWAFVAVSPYGYNRTGNHTK